MNLGEFSRPFDLHHSAGERGGESNAKYDDDKNADRMNDVRVVPAEEREGEQAERADDARVEVLGPSERVARAGLRARGLHASPPKVRGAHGAARASSGLLDLRPHQSLICGSEALWPGARACVLSMRSSASTAPQISTVASADMPR